LCIGSSSSALLSPSIAQALRWSQRAHLLSTGVCEDSGAQSCQDFCLCEIQQLSGVMSDECLNRRARDLDAATAGFCYIDGNNGVGNPELVRECPPESRRRLRFLGADTPHVGATLLLVPKGSD
jgi:hypothetical protein